MGEMKVALCVALAAILLISSCAPAPQPAIDEATVIARFAAVRQRNSATAPTLRTLEPGDKVEVLEQQDDWYLIRLGDLQGWMQQSTIVTQATQSRIQNTVAASQGQFSQNTAILTGDANLRVEPGRETPIIRRLPSETQVEVIDRVTMLRDSSNSRFDVWLKVRTAPTEVGWVLSSLVQFDVPAEIAQYTEDYVYAAVQSVNQVQDSLAGTIHWYVVGERKAGADPQLDFTGIRVFTWNLRRHRYETAYRIPLRGVYPLEVGQDAGRPSFQVRVLSEDGKSTSVRKFVMNGVLVSEITAE
jgi:SH3-like domain-containing protein